VCVGFAPLPVLAEPSGSPLPAVTDEPAPPSGDPPAGGDSIDRAMAAYQRGTQNYNLAQYDAALADFKEAASLYASPDFQYNIALCYEKLGKRDEAIRAYVTYLKVKPDAEDRPNVEKHIKELQLEIQMDEQRRATAEANKGEVTPPPPDIEPEEEPPPKNGRGLVIAGASLVGVGAAVALGGGIGFGVLANDNAFLVDEIQTGGNPSDYTFAEAQAFDKEGKRFEAIQVGLVAGGSAFAVTGAVLLALGLRKRKAARAHADAQAWIGPHSIQTASGRVPGVSLSGRF